MGKTRNTGKLATQIQFDNSNNLVIGTSASSSFNTSGSVNAIGGITGSIFGIGNPTSFSSSISSNLVSIQSVTASNIARLSNLETKSSSVDISVGSINTFTSSNSNTSLNLLTSSLATTGSNSFFGTQVFSGSVYIANDLIVQGSSSIQYISASSVSIGTNIVQLNTATPSVRFAGVSVQDSGSSAGVTGSILWDSLCNRWIYSNPSTIGYSGGMLMSGPRTSTLGTESPLTCNYIAKSGGGDHLYDSCIIDDGTTTCIKNNLVGTGTVCFGGNICTTQLSVRSTLPRIEISSTNYDGSYKSFFGSLITAQGILQFGNNSDNYVLIGNTSAGGKLQFRANVNSDYGYGCGLEAFTIHCDTSVCFAGPVKLAGVYASCLGLGTTTSPAKYLHIQGTNNFTQGIRFSETGGNYSHNIYFGSSDSGACNWGMDFQVATTSATSATVLSLRGNCAVGIGTTSPTALLHARGMAAADVLYRLEPYTNGYASKLLISSTSSGDGGIRYGCGGTNDMNIFSYGNMRFNVGTGNVGGNVSCQRMTIDTDGVVAFSCQICTPGISITSNPIGVEYLIIAGGGGGGWDVGGGGGAGGVLNGSTGIWPGTYNIGIGAGGAGKTGGGGCSTTQLGYNTYAIGLLAVGGGGGGNYSGGWGSGGGSGGGGAGYGATTNAGFGMKGQGFEGGCGINVAGTSSTGGAGGGAGGVGPSSISNIGGSTTGGVGIISTIIGEHRSYGCGGRGGGDNWTGPMYNGTANTGGGGDGAGSVNEGCSGGSGIVILKMKNTNSATFSGGLTTYTCTGVACYNIYVVTAGAGTVTIS